MCRSGRALPSSCCVLSCRRWGRDAHRHCCCRCCCSRACEDENAASDGKCGMRSTTLASPASFNRAVCGDRKIHGIYPAQRRCIVDLEADFDLDFVNTLSTQTTHNGKLGFRVAQLTPVRDITYNPRRSQGMRCAASLTTAAVADARSRSKSSVRPSPARRKTSSRSQRRDTMTTRSSTVISRASWRRLATRRARARAGRVSGGRRLATRFGRRSR